MIFRAVACDYDGTLASEDRMGPAAIAALSRAREAGLRLVLVTGRTFFELTRVCERLDLFDAVVAENGAVLYFPPAGAIRDLAPPPPTRLLADLDRRGVPYQAGRVVVGTGRAEEAAVRDALEATGVSLSVVYNRAALMLLPAGVSKGSGVQGALRVLGLSCHDVLALGDAENDVDLFRACGFAGCPADAVPALREQADWVFPGEDGAAVAEALEGPILGGLLAAGRSPRHRIELGWAVSTAEPVSIPARDVNVLIHGDPLSGKSWLAGALVEQLVGRRYAVAVIDPEGDHAVLAQLPGVTWVEVDDGEAMAQALARFEREPSTCLVVDLSALPHARKLRVIETGLVTIRRLRQALGLPHWVVLDEAHYSLHAEGVGEEAIGLEDKGLCLATYRSSWLRRSVVEAVDLFVLARTTGADELAFLRVALAGADGSGERAVAALPELPPEEFVLVQPDETGRRTAVTFAAPPRQTSHVRHRGKYADARVPPDCAFVFRGPDGRPVGSADSVVGFREAVEALPDGVLAFHAERGDLSRWVLHVFSDRDLGAQLRKIEARWGRGEISDLREAIVRLIALRYG